MGADVKTYKSYAELVEILASRGIDIGDQGAAVTTLRRVNYYRLSGYWYPFRKQTPAGRQDDFYAGTSFGDAVALYWLDVRLRAAPVVAMVPVELATRALLGHGPERIDLGAHLDRSLLDPTVRRGDQY